MLPMPTGMYKWWKIVGKSLKINANLSFWKITFFKDLVPQFFDFLCKAKYFIRADPKKFISLNWMIFFKYVKNNSLHSTVLYISRIVYIIILFCVKCVIIMSVFVYVPYPMMKIKICLKRSEQEPENPWSRVRYTFYGPQSIGKIIRLEC
jgi:hypothetical protein